MPGYYADSAAVTNLLDREYTEINSLDSAVTDVLNQFFIDTATWGLDNWERVCGIVTDATKPDDQRRSVIRSKLRGVGTVTVALVQSVAESYDNGTVNVTEDNTTYTVTITFVSTLGVPPNLTDIQNSLRDIVPAHLGINYVFNFVTYDQLVGEFNDYNAMVTSGKTYDDILNGR